MKTKADKTGRPSGRRGINRFAAGRAMTQRLTGGAPETAIRNAVASRVARTKLQESIDASPRQLAQAERLTGLFGPQVLKSDNIGVDRTIDE